MLFYGYKSNSYKNCKDTRKLFNKSAQDFSPMFAYRVGIEH